MLRGSTLLSYVLAHTYCAAGRVGRAHAVACAAAEAAPADADALALAALVEQLRSQYAEALRRYEEDAGLAPGAAEAAFRFGAGGIEDDSGDAPDDADEGGDGEGAAGEAGNGEAKAAGVGRAAELGPEAGVAAGPHASVQWSLSALNADPTCAAALAGEAACFAELAEGWPQKGGDVR